MKIALAQLNLQVGDLQGNARKIVAAAISARDESAASVIVFPELTLSGYPPEDLLLRPAFMDKVEACLQEVIDEVTGIDLVLGYPKRDKGNLYNTAGVIRDGKIKAEYYKSQLPNYSVFDEKRYFTAGENPCVVEIDGVMVGLSICEDIWLPGPTKEAAQAGCELLLNLNASPYQTGKAPEREASVSQRAKENNLPVIYVNLVGGQDELVFDGGSFAVDRQGKLCHRSSYYAESIEVLTLDADINPLPSSIAAELDERAAIYGALVLGVRDYVGKNGFSNVVLGLSGGIDSALTLAIAVDALGADQVEVIAMPSRYTADMSNQDAAKQAQSMGVKYSSIPIEPAFNAFLDMLKVEFAGKPVDVTEENIQARCRGIILMAVSNKMGKMLLTTGNKSEMSVGYATLYGDMAGGFAPLKDVAKTMVFELARWRNRHGEVIPQRVITRPPSAELRADQQDTDSLPAYDILDSILQKYVEEDQSIEDIVTQGFERQIVQRVTRMVDVNEYKRRQAPPGVKVTPRAYGRDRRYPIVNGF